MTYQSLFELCGALCHQLPERSLVLGGVQSPLCWRCQGIYLFLVLGLVLLPFRVKKTTRKAGFMSVAFVAGAFLLMGIDLLVLQPVCPNNLTRGVSGALTGLALATLVWQSLLALRS